MVFTCIEVVPLQVLSLMASVTDIEQTKPIYYNLTSCCVKRLPPFFLNSS